MSLEGPSPRAEAIYCLNGGITKAFNCIITRNNAQNGGGIFAEQARIVNCTMFNNQGLGHDIYATEGGRLWVYNSILWANDFPAVSKR